MSRWVLWGGRKYHKSMFWTVSRRILLFTWNDPPRYERQREQPTCSVPPGILLSYGNGGMRAWNIYIEWSMYDMHKWVLLLGWHDAPSSLSRRKEFRTRSHFCFSLLYYCLLRLGLSIAELYWGHLYAGGGGVYNGGTFDGSCRPTIYCNS